MEKYKEFLLENHKAPTGELVFVQGQAENEIMQANMAIKGLKDNLNHLISEIDGVLNSYDGSNKEVLSQTRSAINDRYNDIVSMQNDLIRNISDTADRLVATNKATTQNLQDINQRLQVISSNLM